MKVAKIYPKDIIAFTVLIAIFILIGFGHDGWLQGIGAVIIGYYFSKRVYEEKNTTVAGSVKTEIPIGPKTITAKFSDVKIMNPVLTPEEKLKEFSGDFKPVPKREIA